MGLADSIDLKPADRKLLIELLERYLPSTEIWAFGSRVKGKAKTHSDLDLVAFTEEQSAASLLKEAFDESSITISVDLHIWSELPRTFQQNIESAYVVVQQRGELCA
jgi:uncharacterized protein